MKSPSNLNPHLTYMTTLHLTDNELRIIVGLLETHESSLAFHLNCLKESRKSSPESITHYHDKLLAVDQLLNAIDDAQSVAEAAS